MELKNSIHLTNFSEYRVFQNEMTLLFQSTSKAEKRPVNILCGLIMSTFTLKHKHLCYTTYVRICLYKLSGDTKLSLTASILRNA